MVICETSVLGDLAKILEGSEKKAMNTRTAQCYQNNRELNHLEKKSACLTAVCRHTAFDIL